MYESGNAWLYHALVSNLKTADKTVATQASAEAGVVLILAVALVTVRYVIIK